MKKTAFISILSVFAIILFSNNSLATEKNNEKTLTFKVSMDCHGCVQKIEGNIPYEKGVKDLKVSLDKKECTVTYRTDKTSEESIIKAFNKLGYTAEVKKEDKGEKDQGSHVPGHDGHTQNMEH